MTLEQGCFMLMVVVAGLIALAATNREWVSRLFGHKARAKQKVEVGQSKVTVDLEDGTSFELFFEGVAELVESHSGKDFIRVISATDAVTFWRSLAGKEGLVLVDKGKYVPLHRIKEVREEESAFEVEV